MTDPNLTLTGYGVTLRRLAESLPKPIILVIDEIDALVGDSLVSVLRQIRSGYANRPKAFPQSIILCSSVDICDHRIFHALAGDRSVLNMLSCSTAID